MLIDESDDEASGGAGGGNGDEDVEGNAYRENLTSVDGFTRGPNGKVKFNKCGRQWPQGCKCFSGL